MNHGTQKTVTFVMFLLEVCNFALKFSCKTPKEFKEISFS